MLRVWCMGSDKDGNSDLLRGERRIVATGITRFRTRCRDGRRCQHEQTSVGGSSFFSCPVLLPRTNEKNVFRWEELSVLYTLCITLQIRWLYHMCKSLVFLYGGNETYIELNCQLAYACLSLYTRKTLDAEFSSCVRTKPTVFAVEFVTRRLYPILCTGYSLYILMSAV